MTVLTRHEIEVSHAAIADSINRKSAGIRQLAVLMDLRRIAKQCDLNQRLVRLHQDATYPQQAATGVDPMPTSDDAINIGDVYNMIAPTPAAPPAAPQPAAPLASVYSPVGGVVYATAPGAPSPVVVTTPAPPAPPAPPAGAGGSGLAHARRGGWVGGTASRRAYERPSV